jgi:hypothetical protein
MAEFRQTSFAGGEFSPTLWSRMELERFGTGLRTARNFFVTEHGGLKNRAGTELVDEMLGTTRLLRFIFSDSQSYVLCFTNLKLRIASFGGMIESAPGVLLEVTTPYAAADLARLKIAQLGDIVTITHRNYAPRELRRASHTSWALAAVIFDAPTPTFPAEVSVQLGTLTGADSTHPIKEWQWAITVVGQELATGQFVESSPVVVDQKWACSVGIWNMAGVYALGVRVWHLGATYVSLANGNTGFPPTDPTWWTKDGTVTATFTYSPLQLPVVLYPDRVVMLNWDFSGTGAATIPGCRTISYRVYRGRNGIFGFVGETSLSEFRDDGIIPDFSVNPPQGTDPFAVYDAGGAVVSHDYPDVVTYYSQRRWFARLGRLQGSTINAYANFDVSSPSRADQAVDFTLASRAFEEIRSLVGLDMLVPLSASSEWSVRGSGREEVITPTSILARVGSESGSSWVDALVVDDIILHVTAKGTRVRELVFDAGRGRYAGGDLTVYAKHLFVGRAIVDWAYQEEPDHVIWCVLDDGELLSLSYMREQALWAWTHHDTQGTVEAVCVVPEATEDHLYLVVLRNGHRYLERMATRVVTDVRLGLFLDSALTYDGRNTAATTVTVSGGTTWEPDDEVTITASAATFAASNVDDAVVLNPDSLPLGLDPDGSEIPGSPVELTITGYTSPTVVTARLEASVPSAYRGSATTSWALAVNHFSGLSHLEGLSVLALADGSPQGPFTVSAGSITLDEPAAIVHIGLGYDQELETLDFLGPPKSNVKALKNVRLEIDGTRGQLEVGESLSDMQVWDQRAVEQGYGPIPIETLEATVRPTARWATSGRVAIRNTEPTPVTLLAVTREADVGGK